ncbi:7811_t:CDS:2 [Racocetra fulgida]|uniref:7811_t:CDS:1 n=1 Tax=Racocetra fulgida TaxID=60492 RepID=A0A9N9AK12_9GLOM|nr:7811_t:CDS:2 [Racocetra fulgida]
MYFQEDTENIPYEIYFQYYPSQKWARLHYIKETSCASEIRNRAQELLDNKDVLVPIGYIPIGWEIYPYELTKIDRLLATP